MRITPLYGFLALAILVTALVGVLDPADDAAAVMAVRREPDITSRPTATSTTSTTPTVEPVLDREPDIDALGAPVGDLHATTTTVSIPADASARAPSQGPATPTTSPRAVGTPATTAPPVTIQAGPNGEFESQFASKVNGLRSGDGLADLTRDGSLDARARAWAERLASNGGLSHSDLSDLLPPWSAAGENVGSGGSVDGLFGSLAASSGHRANMLGDYSHFGVGVWVDSSGTIWTAHVFTR